MLLAKYGQMLGIEAIKITPELLARTCDIEEFKGLWLGLDKHSTGLNLLVDVAGFGGNFKAVLGPLQEQKVSPHLIRALHANLTSRKGGTSFKAVSEKIEIMPGGALETAAPDEVELLLKKLVDWLNQSLEKKELHPLFVIGAFTAVFLQISPFEDGNMKLARFLVILLMLKSGYAYAPYIPLDKVMNEKAELVYKALKHNQDSLEVGKPDWSEWMNCFLGLLQGQKDQLRERLDSKEKDMSHLPTLSGRIMKLFENEKRLQMKQIIKLTNGRRSTVKLRLVELVDGGYLRRYGQARSTWYSLI